jgi:hypothetical protein
MVRQMEDVTTRAIPPAEEDPVVHRYLASLPQYSPSPGFDDRVMARVFAPAPRWLQGVRQRWWSLVDTGRVWWLLGGFAGAYALALASVLVLVTLHGAAVESFIGSLLSDIGLPMWRGGLGVFAGITQKAYSIFSTTTASGPPSLAAVVSLASVLMANGWMLYRFMQPVQIVRIARNGSR